MTKRNFLKTAGLGALATPAILSSLAAAPAPASIAGGLPSIGDWDVAVLGGGPAGICAAVAAARNGARTILVEKANCAGGMATSGLVGPFMTCYNKSGTEMIIRGLFGEIVDRLVKKDGAIHPSKVTAPSSHTSYITIGHSNCTPFDPEKLKIVADEILAEAGVTTLYHTSFVATVCDNAAAGAGKKINSVVLHSKSGPATLRAKIFIDCTGDGDAAASAGAQFELGNTERNTAQPATMFFRIGNVDSDALDADIAKNWHLFHRKNGINYRSFHWWVEKARQAGDWSLQRVSIGLFEGNERGTWSVNTSRIMGIDGTSAESLTKGEIEGRRQAAEIFSFIKKYLPGCEKAILLSTAAHLGIRETRHIRGDYVLQTEDLLTCKVPADSIVLAANSVDVHGRYGPLSNQYVAIEGGEYYGVPWRCLLPVGFDNLLVAGRPISAGSEAAGAIRVMPPVMGFGQAAGTAAALAVRDAITPRQVPVPRLRQTLVSQGVFL